MIKLLKNIKKRNDRKKMDAIYRELEREVHETKMRMLVKGFNTLSDDEKAPLMQRWSKK